MRADFYSTVGSWLLTYLLHSTLFLGLAWLATQRGFQAAAVRDVIWKTALVGGLATATLQSGLGFEPLGGAMALKLGGSAARQLGSSTNPLESEPSAPDAWRGLIPSSEPALAAAEASSRRAAGASTIVPPGRGAAEPSRLIEPSSRRLAEPPGGRAAEPSNWLLSAGIVSWALIALALTSLYLVQRALAMQRIGPRRPVSDVALLGMLDDLRRVGHVRRAIRLTAAPGLTSPVALGRDEIAIPDAALTDLDGEQQRSMLAHELAHLERRDPTWLALGCLLERAFFLQPLNRLARIRLQESAEYLCDDWAVHRTGSGVSLATCLVKVAEWVDTTPRPVPLSGMAERRSQLVSRIHRLIEGRTMPATSRSFWLLGGAVGLIGVTALVAPGITTARSDLTAQGVVPRAPAAVPDSVESVAARLSREMELASKRARLDAAQARLLARTELQAARAAVAWAPAPPAPPAPAALAAEIRASLARAPRAWAAVSGAGGDRRRDTTSIAVPALIVALKDGDVEVRRAAAQSLSNLEDPRAIPSLIEALRDADAEVRSCAASGLGQFEDKRAVPGLVALLKDSNKDVRHAALSSLGSFRDQVPTEAIVTALGDTDADIKVAALSLAAGCDCDEDKPADPRIVQAVVGLLGHPSTEVRSEAIVALRSLGLKEAPAGLLAASKDKNPEVRQHVAEALGSIQDPRAVPALRELLRDPSADVRESAVNALSEIRDRSALEALVAALKSPDAVVRRHAAEALGQREQER
jgi:HEAT repeat protein/beta-lactamase regulating signal transducer with metallopeptidase domain